MTHPPTVDAALIDALRDLLAWARSLDWTLPEPDQRRLTEWTETYGAIVRRAMEEER